MELSSTPKQEYSPTQIDKTDTMGFPQAIQEAVKGKRIHKLEWKDKGYYGMLVSKVLKLHKPDGKFYYWILSYGDLTGDDYIIV